MLYANNDDVKTKATPGKRARCPVCGDDVIAKCGAINAWHWAHASREDCDPWFGGESAWHLGWKDLVKAKWTEVVMPPHRADIVGINNTVIELQHSSISLPEMVEREIFYGKRLAWLFDMERFVDKPDPALLFYHRPNYTAFAWKHGHSSQAFSQCPIFWDLGNGYRGNIFAVLGFSKPGDARMGYGRMILREEFEAYAIGHHLRKVPDDVDFVRANTLMELSMSDDEKEAARTEVRRLEKKREERSRQWQQGRR